MTLYAIEDTLQALHDSIEMVQQGEMTEADRDNLLSQALAELQSADSSGRAKRDAIAKYIRSLAAQEAAIAQEIDALKVRATQAKRQRESIEKYVLSLVRQYAVPRKEGAPLQLEGNIFVLRLRKNPESVQISDEKAVPKRYQRVEIRGIDYDLYCTILESLQDQEQQQLEYAAHFEISKTKIKEAIESKLHVPGAQMGRTERLEIK